QMKVLYFDCTNGISGDMLLNALMELGECRAEVEAAINNESLSHVHHSHNEENAHHHDHTHHGRSYKEVKHLIECSGFTRKSREYAEAIYRNIAEAEAEVHGESLETIHFHEVGRDQAIKNALGIGMAMEKIAPDITAVSPIYDGRGTVVCSHGEIPVPVPAVRALMKRSTFAFRQAEVDTEMVTPSGLAGLMGIGAMPESSGTGAQTAYFGDETAKCQYKPDSYTVIKETEVHGARTTGRGGLKAYLIRIEKAPQSL
ncbi:MAG: LarC family nickel insertion protein, partial [Clostridiales bacterium]|nr:LarC family nickel insertion protein [Clostridiales bacterium]